MNRPELIDHCLMFPAAYEDYPERFPFLVVEFIPPNKYHLGALWLFPFNCIYTRNRKETIGRCRGKSVVGGAKKGGKTGRETGKTF